MLCSHAHIAAIPGADDHQRARMLREKGVQYVLFFSSLVAYRQKMMSSMVAHHKASVPHRSWIFLVGSKKRLTRGSSCCLCSPCERSRMLLKNRKRMLPHHRSHLAKIQWKWKNSLWQSCGNCSLYQDCYCCSFSFGSRCLFPGVHMFPTAYKTLYSSNTLFQKQGAHYP